MENFETLNQILVSLFRDITDIEQRAIITQEFKDITSNDVHVIDAISIGEPKNMSTIARELSVTVGTLTIAMNSLVKKGYVMRKRGQDDRRVVYISLSEKGKIVYDNHTKFHKDMIDSIMNQLEPEEMKALIKALTKLNIWFQSSK